MRKIGNKPHRQRRWLGIGIAATIFWILALGMVVEHRHAVPSLLAFKGAVANLQACPSGDIRLANQCLDDRYEALLTSWRQDAATVVVLPPMTLWILALLGSLGASAGTLQRRA
ncbi:MAG TPA: hypothetical protein HPQ04_02755 [Rhodospirillaceae bacterium]|nr:hypothetical protein [Rhodospirillaceae bacterium]